MIGKLIAPTSSPLNRECIEYVKGDMNTPSPLLLPLPPFTTGEAGDFLVLTPNHNFINQPGWRQQVGTLLILRSPLDTSWYILMYVHTSRYTFDKHPIHLIWWNMWSSPILYAMQRHWIGRNLEFFQVLTGSLFARWNARNTYGTTQPFCTWSNRLCLENGPKNILKF